MQAVPIALKTRYFNPRSLTGATLPVLRSQAALKFQSTLPYGSDSSPNCLNGTFLAFQSTLPYGSDPRSLRPRYLTRISIHAPLRERPYALYAEKHGDVISIHAPLRERPVKESSAIATFRFQSTLPYGSDGGCAGGVFWWLNFNPRSLTGATFSAS